MKWAEFKQLIAGLGPDTPLGRIVAIRSETDKEVLKRFTDGQKKIRNDWIKKHAKTISKADMDQILEGFKQAFISIAGGVKNK